MYFSPVKIMIKCFWTFLTQSGNPDKLWTAVEQQQQEWCQLSNGFLSTAAALIFPPLYFFHPVYLTKVWEIWIWEDLLFCCCCHSTLNTAAASVGRMKKHCWSHTSSSTTAKTNGWQEDGGDLLKVHTHIWREREKNGRENLALNLLFWM